jgi:hypothetical protein
VCKLSYVGWDSYRKRCLRASLDNLCRQSEAVTRSESSVADPDPGPGAFLTPGPGSGIPNPYFLELSDKLLGKKFYNSLKTASIGTEV